MVPFMVIIIASFRDYCMEVKWDLLMVKCLDLMKASN